MQVSKQAAARFLLFRQGLLAGTPGGLWRDRLQGETGALEAIVRLEAVQVDPVSVLAPNHHLVLAARVGGYRSAHLEALVANRAVVDYLCNARSFVPMQDWPLLKVVTEEVTGRLADEVERLGDEMERVYHLVQQHGPLSARQVEADKRIAGWWDQERPRTKASSMALEILWHLARVGISRREGNERYYDTIERVIPPPLQLARDNMTQEEASTALLRKYMRAFGLFFPRHTRFGWLRRSATEKRELIARMEAAGEIIPVTIDGVQRSYWVQVCDAAELEAASRWEVEPAATLLPPLDNLLWLRERLADLFDFDYTWEIYTPQAKRKYGAYTMPLLIGDRFVGRLDAYRSKAEDALCLVAFYPERWVEELSARERRAHLAPARKAVQLLAQACDVRNATVAAEAPKTTHLLVPT